VVHGKGSLIAKMPGDYWQRFANLRLLFAYMYSQAGKKLLFMGGELAQWREWNHDGSLDWHLTEFDSHRGVQKLVEDLNRLYRSEPALHELDCDPYGFEWIDAGDSEQSVLTYLRRARSAEHTLVATLNFTPVPRVDYRIGVPHSGFWKEVLNTDATEYGGTGWGNWGGVKAVDDPCHGRPFSITVSLPPLAAVFFRHAG
jgi:1,4-alpha-glucan branching enzyme